ncbi:hypothetical protein SAY87_027117 [Trapa incisa]|uniref:4-coumarate--CoA ligase n=1 Tax=Trapa incisa TaxID=236973 RepID=A0AAN7GSV1_9MYRT|nr:hypothetical protein SAY87_027117 [Trapa incisa]
MISVAPSLEPSQTLSSADSVAPATVCQYSGNAAAGGGSDIIFRSRLPDITIPNHLPLHTYCFEKMLGLESGNRPCLIVSSTGKTYTYVETHLMCRRVATGLSNLGISHGDAIMILLPNCPEFVFTFMGASMIGAISTTCNPFYTPAEIFKQLKGSGAKLIVTQSHYVQKLRDLNVFGKEEENSTATPTSDDSEEGRGGGMGKGKDLTVITVDDNTPPENCLHFSVLLSEDSGPLEEVQEQPLDDDRKLTSSSRFDPDDPVALPFSSGTTGLPKGVVLTHRSLVTGVAQLVDGENPNLHLMENDVVLCVLPLFHIFSLHSVLLCSLRAGSTVLLMHKFEIGQLLELIRRHRVTVAAVVPPLVLALARNPIVQGYDLTSLRVILSGAAPLGKELEDALRDRLPHAVLGQGYGMTEAGPVISMCLGYAKQAFPTKRGSCGTVVRNAELKVIDPETGSSLGRGQHGEICVRGQQIMKGYLNDPEATSRTIDMEGWLHTGDIGFVDDDDEMFIVDRLKEIIKFKGFQVPPAELEALLVSHPSLVDAAVVPQKDEAAGEVPVAFVVPSKDVEVSEEVVKEFIAKQVVFYKRLHKVHFVHTIPRSPSGKILRRDLKSRLAATTATGGASASVTTSSTA